MTPFIEVAAYMARVPHLVGHIGLWMWAHGEQLQSIPALPPVLLVRPTRRSPVHGSRAGRHATRFGERR